MTLLPRLFLLLLPLSLAGLPAFASTIAPGPPLAPVDGEVIVRFKADASVLRRHALAARPEAAELRDTLAQRAATLGQRVGRPLAAGLAGGDRVQVVRASGVDAAVLARQLSADPDVEFAVPNGRARILSAPNDPLYGPASTAVRPRGPAVGQWYLQAPDSELKSAIHIEAAWQRQRGSASVVVAVLDTGVRFEHPDLGRSASGGRLLPGYDFVSDAVVANDGGGRDADPTDPGDWVSSAEAGTGKFGGCSAANSSWHGTATASLVGAATDNAVGMAGVAPGVWVLPVRVLGKCFGSDADIQDGMRWAAGIPVPGVPDNPNPARVLNLSLGGDGACSAAYQAVVDEVLARGASIVVAAGNSAGLAVGTPGSCKGVVTVLALRHAGTKVGFSDLGPEITIAAPGGNCVDIGAGDACRYPILAATDSGTQGPVSSGWTDSYRASVGTSFSAPLVAGTAGLMYSVQPLLTSALARKVLQDSARSFPTSGADNGSDPLSVRRCDQPNRYPPNLYPVGDPNYGRDLQCYCTTALCGAGMLDAGAATATAAGPLAVVTAAPASPLVGAAVQLGSSASLVASGRRIVAYEWLLVSGGGSVTGFSSASNAATAALLPVAAGTVVVRLTLTDDLGTRGSSEQTITVADAPVAAGGGGGGALSAGWLWLLAGAVGALAIGERRRGSDGR